MIGVDSRTACIRLIAVQRHQERRLLPSTPRPSWQPSAARISFSSCDSRTEIDDSRQHPPGNSDYFRSRCNCGILELSGRVRKDGTQELVTIAILATIVGDTTCLTIDAGWAFATYIDLASVRMATGSARVQRIHSRRPAPRWTQYVADEEQWKTKRWRSYNKHLPPPARIKSWEPRGRNGRAKSQGLLPSGRGRPNSAP